jgi:hypothetical protein
MSLSTTDAAAHLVENPFVADFLRGREVIVTLLLLVVLGAVLLKGFKGAIAFAVGTYESVANPRYVTDGSEVLFTEV